GRTSRSAAGGRADGVGATIGVGVGIAGARGMAGCNAAFAVGAVGAAEGGGGGRDGGSSERTTPTFVVSFDASAAFFAPAGARPSGAKCARSPPGSCAYFSRNDAFV